MKDKCDISKIKSKGKRINSRTKGNSFERKVCNILNKRFNTDHFNRSPGSGAYATIRNLPKEYQIHGDLITPSNFKFSIECKKGYNDVNIDSLLNKKSSIWKFIDQAINDSRKSNKLPLIVYQQDRRDILILAQVGVFVKKKKKISFPGWEIYTLKDALGFEDSEWFVDS